MGLILEIILGAIAGWIASAITRSGIGIWMDILLGIVGAVVGGFIMSFFGAPGVTGFNFYSLFVAVLGAIVLIGIGRLFSGGSRATY